MQNCEDCGGKKWFAHIDRKTGLQRKHHVVGDNGYERDIRIWKCWRCGKIQEEIEPFIPLGYRTTANILYVDIEVSKSLYFNYGNRVPSGWMNIDDLYREKYIICWAASYVGSKTVWSDCVTGDEARGWTDARILPRLRELMDSADIIAGHNVDAFDIKHINAQLLLNNLEPVTGKKTLDTLKIARSKFKFESNKLDYISRKLGLRPKDNITNDDWLEIVKTGSEKTLAKVLKYNKGDVTSGKGVLQRLMKYSGKRTDYGAQSLDGVSVWMKGKKA
jgi:DNA polymerase elongation subunit (family B)